MKKPKYSRSIEKPKYPRIPEHLKLGKTTPIWIREVIPMMRKTLTIRQIAEICGIAKSTVQRWLETPEQRKAWNAHNYLTRDKQKANDTSNKCHKRRQKIMSKEQKTWYREFSRYKKAKVVV